MVQELGNTHSELPTVNGEVETSAIRTQGSYRDVVAASTRELS